MNIIKLPATPRAAIVLTAAWAGLIVGPGALRAADAQYDNYIDVAAGGSDISGDKAAFQKLTHQDKNGLGGLSGFYFGKDLSKDTTLTFTGHALAGNNDLKLDLKLVRTDVAYLDVGYSTYRVWYDGSGGFLPNNGLFVNLYDDDMHIDRSDLWVELGLTPPEKVNFNFRYDYLERDGLKDSTSWGDLTAGTLGARAIVPTFLRINEKRQVFNAKAFQETEQTSWEVSGRYETTKQDNSREMRRAPGQSADRYITQTDVADSDMFMLHGSVETKIGETLTMSTGMAHYDLDTNISGSRIYGSDSYDPVFSPTYARRQYHDEGFYGLEGQAHMSQTLANLNLMYTPSEVWTVVPSLLAEKTNWSGKDEYVETAVGGPPALAMGLEDLAGDSSRSFRTLTEQIEARYVGFKNIVLNTTLEANQGYGMLDEDMAEAETGELTLYRTTNYRREGQKYTFTGHYYARPGLSFTAQYYWKGKQNAFNNTADSVSAAPSSGDRYPGYITHQDFETNDANVRVTWTPMGSVRTVSRYDYQETKIRTQVQGLAFIDSGKVKSHIFSETLTWNPVDRWYVQASGNIVYDRTETPAQSIAGAVSGAVLRSDNDYVSGDFMTGYALDDKTDVTATYSYYKADNYVNNAAFSVPYGAGQTYQTVGLQWFRRVSPQLNYLIKYAYGDNADELSGGQNNFRAHAVYAKVQYRF
jgi:hypothetical protein